jgi:hypothetical protein
MIASVHVADIGIRRSLPAVLRRPPDHSTVRGLRQAQIGVCGELGKGLKAPPQLGRVMLIGFWDDADAIDAFEATHPLGALLGDGFRVRGEPLRAHGSWPGLPEDVPTGRRTDYAGQSLVLTLGRLRAKRARAFFKASAGAEASLLQAPGVIWATALARPPFVSTCSLWESTKALSTYAYGNAEPGHPNAIHADDSSGGFHHQSAFIRFRPVEPRGHLEGRNPLAAMALAGL